MKDRRVNNVRHERTRDAGIPSAIYRPCTAGVVGMGIVD
jgi:hypothetical protein